MARPEENKWWSPYFPSFPHPSPLQHVQFVKLYNIENCYAILGNYSLVFVTKLQRISHFKFEFFLPSSNFLVPPFYPKKTGPNNQDNSGAAAVKRKPKQGRSQRESGAGGAWAPSVRNPSPLSPQMKLHFLQGSMESRQFESRSAPVPAPLAPPHFEKASYAPANDTAQNIIEFDLLYSWSIYFTSPVKH